MVDVSSDEQPKVKHEIQQKFKIKDLGEANNVLGLEIGRDKKNGVLSISQEKYAKAIFST